MQNPVLNPVYREQEHRCYLTKLDGTRLMPHVRCSERLQGTKKKKKKKNLHMVTEYKERPNVG